MTFAITATVLVVVGSGYVALALRLGTTALIALAWTVTFTAHLVGLVLVCGVVLRELRPTALLVTTAIVTVAEVLVLRSRAKPAIAESRAVLRARTRRWWSPLVLTFSLLAGAQYLWQTAIATRLPQVSYDTLTYHLIAPATWIQHGAIVHTGQNLYADVYPQDQEAVTAWLGTFLHSLRYAGLTPLPFVVMGAIAVIVIARHLGVRPAWAAVAGLAYICLPAMTVQAATGYNDIAAASAVLAALAFLVELPGAVRPGEGRARGVYGPLIVLGLAVGLAIGTKTSNLVIAAFVAVALVVQFVRVHDEVHPRLTLPKARVLAVVVGVPVLLLGGFWYVRTYLRYDNPFYPVTMLGFEGWGPVDEVVIGANLPPELATVRFGVVGQVVRSWLEDTSPHSFVYDQRLGGFGPQWLVLAFPALVAMVVALVRRGRSSLVLLLVFPVVAAMFASPAPWWARYTLPLAALGAVAVTFCMERLATSVRRPITWLAGPLGFVMFGLTALGMWWATDPTYFATVNPDGTIQDASFTEALDLVIDPVEQARFSPWDAYRVLDDLPTGSVIGLTPTGEEPFTYPWVGEGLDRRLVLLHPVVTPDELAAEMSDSGASYVALRSYGNDGALGQAVAADRSRFLPRTIGGPLNGADVYQLGEWLDCGQPTLVIGSSSVDETGTITVAGGLVDRCGPISGAEIQRWANATTGGPWQGHDELEATTRTGPLGIFSVTFSPDDDPATRYFLRYPGLLDDGQYKPSAATRLFTELEARNGVAGDG